MMESKQFVSDALPWRRAARGGGIVVAAAVLALVSVLTACGGGDVIEPITVTTPTAVVGDAVQVPNDTAPEPDGAGSTETTTDLAAPGPTGRLIDDPGPVSDVHGNLLTVHAMQPWPAAYDELRPLSRGDIELAGSLDETFGAATSIAALDVSLCARTLGDVDVADTTGVFTIGNKLAVPSASAGNGSLPNSHTSLQPGFSWPDVGQCSRGWVAVATTANLRSELYAHYWPAGDDDGRHVLAWSVPASLTSLVESDASFGPGQTVTFNGGSLTGASVVIDGWAELVGAPAGADGTRPVGLLVQGCPAGSGAWPTIGLSIDGWNLAEISSRTVVGLDEFSESSDACDTGWLIFDVPHGGRVTGAFVAGEPGTPGAHWSLSGAALPDPS